MEPNTLYIAAGAVLVLLVVLFVISKVVGCGFKILKAIIILAILVFVCISVKTLIFP